jgi:hypothetical protein
MPLTDSVPFELSRPVIQHGNYDAQNPSTIYDVARQSFVDRWEELCTGSFAAGLGTIFDSLKHVPHTINQPRIISVHRHQIEQASLGHANPHHALIGMRDRLASSPSVQESARLYLDIGSTAFSNIVSTVTKQDGFDKFIFTLQPSEEVLNSGKAPKKLMQLVEEQGAQLEALKAVSKAPIPDTELMPGFPIAEFSWADLSHLSEWKAFSAEDHEKFNEVLTIASIALEAAVSHDVGRALHPVNSANLFGFNAGPSQQLNFGPEVPAPRRRGRSRDLSFLDEDAESISLQVPTIPPWRSLLLQPQGIPKKVSLVQPLVGPNKPSPLTREAIETHHINAGLRYARDEGQELLKQLTAELAAKGHLDTSR